MSCDILVLDDSADRQEMLRADIALRNPLYAEMIKIISVFSTKDALEQFKENPDLAVIVLSGCVFGRHPDTIPLAKKFRETFKGPMIAISTLSYYQNQLVAAGCDYTSSKDYLPRKILEVLGLRKPPS